MSNAWRFLLISSLALAGCGETRDIFDPPIPAGAMAYTGYDAQGAAVVRGWVKLDLAIVVVDPLTPVNVTGSWELRRIGSGELGPQVGRGDLEGLLQGGSLFVNFNPGRADDNVYADGAFEVVGGPAGEMRWDGVWTWSTLAGPRRTGTFRARG